MTLRAWLRASSMACALASVGCLVSGLQPIYGAGDILFDEALLGDWRHAETETGVSITRGEWRSYRIAFTDRFGTTRYDGRLTGIGGARFLNVLPHEGLEQPPFIVATNGFVQVEIGDGQVRVREPDYAAVSRRAAAQRLGIDAATDVKRNVIIAGSTAKLRAWLAAAVKDDALWADWKTFTRSGR